MGSPALVGLICRLSYLFSLGTFTWSFPSHARPNREFWVALGVVCADKIGKAKALHGEAEEGVAVGGLHKVGWVGSDWIRLVFGGWVDWSQGFLSSRPGMHG